MTSATISNWQFSLGSAASPQILTSITEVFNVSRVGKTNQLVDVTNFDSPTGSKEFIGGLAEGDEFTVECNYVPASTSQEMARVAVDTAATRLFRLAYTGTSPNKRWSGSVVCVSEGVVPSATERNTQTYTFKVTGNISRT